MDWSIRTLALTYWLDCNDPLLCKVALVLNRYRTQQAIHMKRITTHTALQRFPNRVLHHHPECPTITQIARDNSVLYQTPLQTVLPNTSRSPHTRTAYHPRVHPTIPLRLQLPKLWRCRHQIRGRHTASPMLQHQHVSATPQCAATGRQGDTDRAVALRMIVH